uniref:Uncharacterized protein n=1 Tax=Anguilla anguilla TaxID=7936 RepID=A0A0E9RBT4_ANGAN
MILQFFPHCLKWIFFWFIDSLRKIYNVMCCCACKWHYVLIKGD